MIFGASFRRSGSVALSALCLSVAIAACGESNSSNPNPAPVSETAASAPASTPASAPAPADTPSAEPSAEPSASAVAESPIPAASSEALASKGLDQEIVARESYDNNDRFLGSWVADGRGVFYNLTYCAERPSQPDCDRREANLVVGEDLDGTALVVCSAGTLEQLVLDGETLFTDAVKPDGGAYEAIVKLACADSDPG
ncbi:MAG: hypothetical protein AAF889_00450 [Cyanobacteria bacterium P01_D01_bin.73]